MITIHLVVSLSIGLFLPSPVQLSPITYPIQLDQYELDPGNLPAIPSDFCVLTPSLGHTGSIKFVEDCENLDMFPTLPIPGYPNKKIGTHPIVCCPSVNKNDICFPTDPWCPTYKGWTTTPPPIDEDLEDYGDYEVVTDPTILIDTNVPKISDEDCSSLAQIWGNETRCVNLKDCPDVFGPHINPTSIPPNNNPIFATFCGWDNEDKAAKVCCPGSFIQTFDFRVEVEPRFPGYKCQDKVSKCQQWKDNHGCRTDMDFVIDPEDPDNGRAISKTMFDFMTGACMETCELCGDKGCRDEYPDCPDWARQGYCVFKPDLMVHTCRESCGVCGFLSADDTGEQTVGENTYTVFRNPNFDCGRYKMEQQLSQNEEDIKDNNSEDDDLVHVLDDAIFGKKRRNKRVTGSLKQNENVTAVLSSLSISFSDDDLEDYGDYEVVTDPPIFIDKTIPKVSDEDCSSHVQTWGNETRCVNLKDCPDLFGPHINPTSILPNNSPIFATFCGWDNEDKAAKVCCPGSFIQTSHFRVEVEPRFPGYKCQDKVRKCQQWKDNHGCRTDMDFVIDPDEPENGRSISKTMFDFMTGASMETCELCGDKGCRDEYPDCPDWARQGYCVVKPDLMVHTCRESCGVCGFLSTDDTREQRVGENTYTDFRDPNFDCGRYKKEQQLSKNEEDIFDYSFQPISNDYFSHEEHIKDNNSEDIDSVHVLENAIFGEKRRKKRVTGSLKWNENVIPVLSSLSVFFYLAQVGSNSATSGDDSGLKFCGATLVTDKWMITAAHCFDDYGSGVGQPTQVEIGTTRDYSPFTEIIEIKRKYKHPKNVYPNLYNDIALLELGRRVEYNWEKYGDSPLCIDRVGKNATMQGYGATEYGTQGDLSEAYLTVISNDECNATLAYNTTGKPTIKATINYGLPNGLTDDMFCAQGTENPSGVFSGACAGDGGGPLFVRREDGRQMLVGIVSGGTGCGQGYPGWYTKVSYFVPWIECIMDNRVIYKNDKEKIEEECGKVAEQAEEEHPDNYIFGGDFYGEDDNEYYDVE